MATAVVEPEAPIVEPTLRERAVDAVRHVAHISHEARMLKSVASDAVDEGVYRARKALKNARRDVADVRDEAVYRIKQEPLKAVGAAVGVGVVVGFATGMLVYLVARGATARRA